MQHSGSSRSGRPWGAVALAVAVAVLLVLPAASSIKCYQCSSLHDEDCMHIEANSTKAQKFLKECDFIPEGKSESDIFCRKIDQTILGADHRRITRKCGYEQSNKHCYHFDDGDHYEMVCQCFHDACNDAPGQASASPWTILAALASGALLLLAR